MLRIAHISDLHFFQFPKTLEQLFSRNGIGILNHSLFRKKFFHEKRFQLLLEDLLKEKIDEVWISGDLTVSGTVEEFQLAKEALSPLMQAGIRCRFVPGNHDLRSNAKEAFYEIFCGQKEISSVERIPLNSYWDLIILDASHNDKKRDSGAFTEELEKELWNKLKECHAPNVAIVCHYPPPIAEGPQNRLVRGKELEVMLTRVPKVKLFAHGHTHRQTMFTLDQVIVANPGVSRGLNGRYNIYQLTPSGALVYLCQHKEKESRVLVGDPIA